MTKPVLSAAPLLAPMQEGIDRLHGATEKLGTTCADIASHNYVFLQRTVFDALTEIQGLSRVRNPTEFLELAGQFAWQQAERNLKAWGDLCNDVSRCWLEALDTTPPDSAQAPMSRARR